MEQSLLCSFGIEQTIKHIVGERPIIKFEGGTAKLREAKTEAINWLNSPETPL